MARKDERMKIMKWLSGIVPAVFAAGVLAAPASTPIRGTLKLSRTEDGGYVYAHKARISFWTAIKIATRKVPGRVAWLSPENIDGYLFHMVQVVTPDRSLKIVTIDAGNGRIVKVEPQAEKPRGTSGQVSFKGTLSAVGMKTSEFPYAAKITLERAMRIALKRYPGRFREVYIYEGGGWLFWGIEIASDRKREIMKIDVDAGSGAVVNMEPM